MSSHVDYRIRRSFPPNFGAINRAFRLRGRRNVVYTYGDTIYAPDGNPLPDDLIVHELVHVRQQGGDPAGWWEQYIGNREFRLVQELEAYRSQLQYADRVMDRASFDVLRVHAIKMLSGSLYGHMISRTAAEVALA